MLVTVSGLYIHLIIRSISLSLYCSHIYAVDSHQIFKKGSMQNYQILDFVGNNDVNVISPRYEDTRSVLLMRQRDRVLSILVPSDKGLIRTRLSSGHIAYCYHCLLIQSRMHAPQHPNIWRTIQISLYSMVCDQTNRVGLARWFFNKWY